MEHVWLFGVISITNTRERELLILCPQIVDIIDLCESRLRIVQTFYEDPELWKFAME